MKKLLLIYGIACTAGLSSCSAILDDAEYAPDIKLGAKVKTVDCYSTYGDCSFDVVSNCEYQASIVKGAEWLSFTGQGDTATLTLKGNSTLFLSYTANRGYRRSARVVLTSGARSDTLTVRQIGVFEQHIAVDTDKIDVPGEGGKYSVGISTNLLKKDFMFETLDSKGYQLSDKADKYKYDDGLFSFVILPSESRDQKTFLVRIYALDDWGEKVAASITITQQPGRE